MKKILITSILFCIAETVLAQKGFVRGKVLDAETGEALIGATISEQGTTIGTVADFEGNYSLPLETGSHTIVFQFVSYQTKTVENVEIVSGQVNTLDVNLSTDVAQLAEVVVQAEMIKDSEAAVLALQKKSANVLDGISSQSFRKIGDGNLSEAMKRVTGVTVQGGKYVYVRGLGDRYTRTTLNGMSVPGLDPERNDVQIDLFPTSVLENVIVYKTFSPELAGDFTGGTVNVETKSFPEEKVTRVSFGVGYNPKMNFIDNFDTYKGGKYDFLGFDDGTRDLPIASPKDEVPRPTSPEPGAGQELEALTRKLDPTMAVQKKNNFLNTSFSFNHGNQINKGGLDIGYGLVLNYQKSYDYYANTEFSRYFKDSDPEITALDPQLIKEGSLGKSDVLWSALVSGAIKLKNNEIGIRFLRTQNGRSQATDRISRDIEETGQTAYNDILTYTQRSLMSPTIYGKHSLGDLKVEWSNSYTKARVYDPDFRDALIAETGTTSDNQTYSIDGGDGGGVRRFWRDLNEENENFRVDATYDLGEKDKLKFGGAGLLKWRAFETYAFQLRNGQTIQNDPDVLLQPENIWVPEARVGTYLSGDYQPANNYEAWSAVYAAYIMNDVSLTEKLRAIYGVRAEMVNMYYTGANTQQQVYDDQKTMDELDWLPSLNLVYSISENTNVRTSYGRTLARPSFREKSIAQILDPISGILFNGNMDLQETNIDNFDLRIENFFGMSQMIAVSAFYKKFEGHIEQVRYQIEPTQVTWQNIGGSEVYGLELEFRKDFDFGLSVGSNFLLAKSKVDMSEIIVDEVSQTTEYESRAAQARTGEDVNGTRVMAGQAPYLINAYLNYGDVDNLTNINLSYHVQGESLAVVGVGNVPDVYVKPFNSLNLNISRNMGQRNKSQMTLGVENILGDVKEEVWKNYHAADEIFSSYDMGRTFSLKYSYTF